MRAPKMGEYTVEGVVHRGRSTWVYKVSKGGESYAAKVCKVRRCGGSVCCAEVRVDMC